MKIEPSEGVSKVIPALITVFIIRAPTGKSVGSEKVIKIRTDGFTRRSNKKKGVSTFETPSQGVRLESGI